MASYPIKLFQLLCDRSAVDMVLADFVAAPCLFDQFSLEHVKAFPDREQLLSEASVQILSAVAGQFTGSIYSTECLHSHNSKRAQHRLTHGLVYIIWRFGIRSTQSLVGFSRTTRK